MTARELVQSYLSSFDSGDPAEIASHVSEDFENDQVGELGVACRGREIYQQRLAGFLGTFKNLHYSVEEIIEADNRAAVTYTMRAIDKDRPIEIRGVMIVFVQDGLITKRSDYWDGLSYQKQVSCSS
ncbi:MAG: ketosteroid isomerase-like protein [Gammaproteobacteria bacterium]|jgi:ketosteroid isomerase-like protein